MRVRLLLCGSRQASLWVTFEPGSITKPAHGATIVNFVFGVKVPRNCKYTPVPIRAITISATSPMVL
jgi:hypothetical protein